MSVGLNGQLGWAKESTKGTRVTPTDFVELNSSTINLNQVYIPRTGIRAGAVTDHDVSLGAKSIEGTFSFDLSLETIGSLLEACVGDVDSTAGSDPYTHTYTPKATRDSLTIQVGIPGTGGTVHPFDYTGCMVSSWTISANSGEMATMEVTVAGRAEDAGGQSLATASYGQTLFLNFTHGDFEIASSEVAIRSVSVTGTNEVRTDNPIGSTWAGAARVLENGKSAFTGTAVADFEDLTQYNRFVNGTEATATLAFTSGSYSLTITGNVYFTGETPDLSGPGIMEQPIPFTFVPSTPSGDAVTITLVNSDATP